MNLLPSFLALSMLASPARGDPVRISLSEIPSFTRQTGLACNVCHTAFPQLTEFGRRFKLNGYTLTGLQVVQAGEALKIDLIPPVSAMAQASATAVKTTEPGTQNTSIEFPQELSVFLGEEITPRLGTFLQLTYEGQEGSIAFDNAEIRYANQLKLASKEVLYGFTLNNNPGVQDVWNSTPVWGYPYASSGVAPSPTASVLLDERLGQQVAGLGTYAFWNQALYGEFALYRSAPQGSPQPLGSTAESTVFGVAPYWRAALQHRWGFGYLEVGTYGLSASLFPEGVEGPLDHFTDVAFDAQFERPLGRGSFTAHATWIHESQTLNASVAAGDADNTDNTLNAFRANAGFYTAQRLGGTLAYFTTTGTTDAGLYAPAAIEGSASGSPNSAGLIGEIHFMPWLNTRFSVQYVVYTKFNGGKTDYDGFGRNAADNNTLYVLTWLAF